MHRFSLIIVVSCISSQLLAAEVRVQVATQKPPFYVGEPVVIQFTVEGLDEQPPPTCAIDTESGQVVPGLRGQMGGTNASLFSQVIPRDGQFYRVRQIKHQVQYLVTADRPGDFQVGPFLIKQGNKEARVKAVAMSFEAVPSDPNMNVRLILLDKPIYPDQRVPVAIEWWYAGELKNVLRLSIYSPLFDQFRFGPENQPAQSSAQLPIDTKNGRLALPATARKEQIDGRSFIVVSASRTLIPDRAGEFPIAPITATLRKATKWARSRSAFDDFDDFGFGGSLLTDLMDSRRRPAQTALSRAAGMPQKLIVQPFPVKGRPDSFAGAVGDGFSIDVSADRTVVRVGDPITLSVTVRGDGNIENTGLPSLSADGGMDPSLFRLPEGDVSGSFVEGAKQFHLPVRVADESVAEIPALAFSWFNPISETYQTARSKPIALRVMPAQVVSASDVVSRRSSTPAAGGVSSNERDQRETASATANRPLFSLSGADLAIESDAGVVLRDAGRMFAQMANLQTAIYAAGCLLIVVALMDRKRRAADPVLTARRRTIRAQQTRIADASRLARPAAAEEIAAAIRVLIAEVPDIDRAAAQAVVAECESIAYAPGNATDSRLDEALVGRARNVAEV